MKSPDRASVDRVLEIQQARRMARLSNELHQLASVLAPAPEAASSSPVAVEMRRRKNAKRQRIHVALLIENGLIEADGRPAGWTIEADIAEENLALSELAVARRKVA